MENGLIKRNLLPVAQEMIEHAPVVVISGARQVGKSTLMQMLLGQLQHRLVNLDGAVARESAIFDPEGFADQFPEGVLAIDEVQRVPDLLLSIKLSVDRKRRAGRFLLTGSANLLTASGSQESLAGRAQTIRLYGLSQGELRGRVEDFAAFAWALPTLTPSVPTEVLSRAEYLKLATASCYPELQGMQPRAQRRWIDSYLERVLSKDVGDVSGIRLRDRLRPLMSLIAAENTSEFVNQRYGQALDLPARSVPSYMQALEDVFLIHRIPAWGHNLSKRAVAKPKICVADPGVAAHLAGVNLRGLEHDISSSLTGGFIEAFVVGELFKQQGWSEVDFTVHHWRDSGNGDHEVDIVLENRAREIVGVEVKAQTTLGAKHFKGLQRLRDLADKRFVAGIVLYTGSEVMPFGDRLWAMPINSLWEANYLPQ
ncbi:MULTISPECIES: ATP-binding protein [Actinomycetes]|uniref:ATP-binding protein n=1 Tax=Buchananella hordeovulneris TaxID=52770 RepID=A0A1Q5PW31_9ACTO|nr:ATP-binding protein [Buchananella hordeovulneris]MDO5084664.1 ATP-binding protein [Arachnia propionica]OKL51672.1 hypothetical protein BSZ40_05815 [Buchananella hordeovulneris]